MAKKKLSAGVIVTDGINVLVCHVTDADYYDLPKGGIDDGESERDAAVRELYEETGLVVDPKNLDGLGTYRYKKHKDLSLWLWMVDVMPDPNSLECLSTFDSGKGIHKKEMDGFAVVPWSQVKNYVVPPMMVVLDDAKKIIFN
jgi:8-oxo-dGTP pyrophosphatase MutT (NUDIX family)